MGVSDSRNLEVDTSDPQQLQERGNSYTRHAEELLEHKPFYRAHKHVQEDAAEDYVQAANSFKLAKNCANLFSFLFLTIQSKQLAKRT